MHVKKDAILFAPAACVAMAGLVLGVDTPEADLSLKFLLIGTAVWTVMLVYDMPQLKRAPELAVLPFRGHGAFFLVLGLATTCMFLFLLFVVSLALILVTVEGEWPDIVICAAAVLVLVRVTMPQMKTCVRDVCALRRQARN